MRSLPLLALLLAGCTATPVAPVIDSAAVVDGYLTASGHVTGVSESGGTCRFTFWSMSGGGASRLTSTATAAGDRTVCGEVSEQATMLLPGGYERELSYESGGTTVKSARVPVSIP